MTVDEMGLSELIDRLEDLEGRRTPVGWSPDDAVERVAIERRIMELVGDEPPDAERRRGLRLSCDLAVKLRTKDHSIRARVSDIGHGGVFVATDVDVPVGTVVELEVRGEESDEHGLRVRGAVAWRDEQAPGLGISFTERGPTAAHERRLRRFVLELLRHRIQN
ncbi:MAG TPA: PilZ domain-containing protein [Kofleriaceae bacterium]|nr:PilZ domain-containing protein [Kofleriaceae bacterium]